ncbi:MAG: VWA domain-containing protein [Rhodobacteraceae bacterium]|nr:VWA domain-containing protein [Paracoccaceae bacterium]
MNTSVLVLRILAALLALLFVYVPTQLQAQGRTSVILDGSSSMNKPFDNGTRLDSAKEAVHHMFDLTLEGSPDHEVPFLSFYAGCWVHVMVGPAPLQDVEEELRVFVGDITPKEYAHTPIICSLERAAKLLDGSPGHVMLVSDGRESCDFESDICLFAEGMASENVNLEVVLIGKALAPHQVEALRCIPEATGSAFVNVGDATALETALGFAAELSVNAPTTGCWDNRGGLLHWWCED